MTKDLTLAIQAAKKAGELVLKDYSKAKKISRKGFNDFVTKTDVKAERIIIDHLKKTGYSVLGEETGETDSKTKKKWVIDPLDGTSNFIRGFPFFAVSIALIEDNNNLLLGVIYDPISKDCYWAEKDKGAYVNNKKIRVSSIENFDGANILVEHNRPEKSINDFVKAITAVSRNKGPVILRQGSTALMLCYVAKGASEAFLSSGDGLYDYAAGLIIAKEAGAIITDWNGKSWDNSSSYILASNPQIHRKIIDRISGIQ